MTKIFVGGLPYQTDDDQLQQIFSSYGEISSAKVITDRDSGRSKGFGFRREMNDDAAAQKAIAELHEAELGGRGTITVQRSTPDGAAAPQVAAAVTDVAAAVVDVAATAAGAAAEIVAAAVAGGGGKRW